MTDYDLSISYWARMRGAPFAPPARHAAPIDSDDEELAVSVEECETIPYNPQECVNHVANFLQRLSFRRLGMIVYSNVWNEVLNTVAMFDTPGHH